MRRFLCACVCSIGVLLVAPAAAQVAPIDLDHGEQVTISCAPAPPACPAACGDGTCDPGETTCSCSPDCGQPPAAENLCADGADNDCDASIDCADQDCLAAPECSPPSGGGEDLGLVRKWTWDDAHAVVADTVPVETICMGCQPPVGSWVHHLLDGAGNATPQEATEPDVQWGPTAEADGIRLVYSENDQLQLMHCSSLDPLDCEEQPWTVGATEPWIFAFVGEISGAAAITGCSMSTCPGISILDVTAGGGMRIRMHTSGRVTISTDPIVFNQPVAFLVEYDGAGHLSVQRRDPCTAWRDATAGEPFNFRGHTIGCLSCYYPNGWLNEAGTEEPHYPGLGLLREVRIHEADPAALRSDLFSYIDAEHGAWIDQGCAP